MRNLARAACAAFVSTMAIAGCGGAPAASPDAPAPTRSPAEATPPATRTQTPTEEASAPATEDAAAAGTSVEGCAPIEKPPVQAGSHLIGDAAPPAPYSSTPPTSGWHSSGALDVRIHGADDPLGEPQQVSVLEADGVVITYRDLPADRQSALEQLVRERYDGRVALTPYEKLEPGEVALTAWGTLQRCVGVDVEAITEFVDAHTAAEVAPGHQH